MGLASAEATEAVGRRVAEVLRAGDVLTLEGGLGAGKTTLARGLLRGLGFADDAPSPTFAILQGYEPPEVRLPLAHVDLYRIEEPGEIEELGLDEWLEGGALVIEWPDRLDGRYGQIALGIRLDVMADGTRHLTARLPKSWEARWPFT
ncbi:tRNA (adenosine(37)-N6)-threonylcarbamoyltransferase complex ATPase subunit type 1 TsaE [Sphingobium sp. H33]|uniref:tRNA threonylcarbamoyladenosine biosynthesis protein TsaE n=1 Tax=Sphingobium nicotianae TaxID=2782607 RepID=A0A9X1DG11_9SPHN|nr:tRNA (adenosine(37)-N6)-threonylcarbamoyltransferase complex ATPase subunit type 1 TsaE [Sphingobium nicotianae]